jgi:hypothetical protein
VPAERCAVVGDSELKDNNPGRERGCMTMGVAIEEPLSAESGADHVLGSLDGLADLILR